MNPKDWVATLLGINSCLPVVPTIYIMQMEVEAGKSIAIAGVQQQGGVLEGGAPLSDRSMAVGCVCCLSV